MDLKAEAIQLKSVIELMRNTAIELRQKGGEPSDNFKRCLCRHAEKLKEVNRKIAEEKEDKGDKQSCINGQDHS